MLAMQGCTSCKISLTYKQLVNTREVLKVEKIRFAGWVRVSTDEQEQKGSSLEVQRQQITEAVERLGGSVVKWYGGQETGLDGPRPKFMQMLAACSSGTFDAVICLNGSRYARGPLNGLLGIKEMRKHSIRFFELEREIDLWDDTAEFMQTVAAAGHKLAVATSGKKTNDSRIERARRGFPSSGGAPWGRLCTNFNEDRANPSAQAKWTVDPACKRYAEKMWKLYRGNKTWTDIAKAMHADPAYWAVHFQGMSFGVKKRRRSKPSVDKLAVTIRRRMWSAGTKWEQTFMQRGKVVSVLSTVPALIPDEAVAELKQHAAEHQASKAPKETYLLNRVVRCHQCGAVMSASTHHGPKKEPYKNPIAYFSHPPRMQDGCTKRVRVNVLEPSFMAVLQGMLASTDKLREALRAALAAAPDGMREAQEELATVERALATATERQDELIKAYAKLPEGKTKERLDTQVKELDADVTNLESRQAQLQAKVASLKTSPDNAEALVDNAVRAIAGWRAPFVTWPHEAQRQLVRWLFGASGSLKGKENAGVYVRRINDEQPYEYAWTAKGWWGDARAAIQYGDEGLEFDPGNHTWLVPQERLGEVVALVTEHDIKGVKLTPRKGLKLTPRKRAAANASKSLQTVQLRGTRAKSSKQRWRTTRRR
jgi:DNA invertase Pin-like site-specific DNA recombinase